MPTRSPWLSLGSLVRCGARGGIAAVARTFPIAATINGRSASLGPLASSPGSAQHHHLVTAREMTHRGARSLGGGPVLVGHQSPLVALAGGQACGPKSQVVRTAPAPAFRSGRCGLDIGPRCCHCGVGRRCGVGPCSCRVVGRALQCQPVQRTAGQVSLAPTAPFAGTGRSTATGSRTVRGRAVRWRSPAGEPRATLARPAPTTRPPRRRRCGASGLAR